MDAVDILLFCVVCFSVLAFLILGYLEERRKNSCRDHIYYDYYEEGEGISVGAGTEKQLISEKEEEGEINFVSDLSCEKSGFGSAINGEEFNIDDDDDWEGIERSELEKIFGEALVFVNCNCKYNDDHQIHEDLKLELYGLSKIALEGPCYGSQPMAFKLSARSNWNAWQKLGNMSREMAMEKYIDILSTTIPSWNVRYKFYSSQDENAAASEDLT